MNEDSKLWQSICGSSPRTELSRRREAEQREQRRRNGDVDPQGRNY